MQVMLRSCFVSTESEVVTSKTLEDHAKLHMQILAP